MVVIELAPHLPAPNRRDTVIQLKLHNRAVDFWKRRYKDQSFAVKISPVSLRGEQGDGTPDIIDGQESSNINDHLQDGSIIKISILNDHQSSPRPQEQFGHRYDPDEFVIFITEPIDFESVTFMVDFYVENDQNGCPIPERIGFCYVLPSNLVGTSGSCTMPITGKKHLPVGQFSRKSFIFANKMSLNNFNLLVCSGVFDNPTAVWSRSWNWIAKQVESECTETGCRASGCGICSSHREVSKLIR
jgi:hypothetical protein